MGLGLWDLSVGFRAYGLGIKAFRVQKFSDCFRVQGLGFQHPRAATARAHLLLAIATFRKASGLGGSSFITEPSRNTEDV